MYGRIKAWQLNLLACCVPGVGKSSIINALRFNALTAQQGRPTGPAGSDTSDEEAAQQLVERLGSHSGAGTSGGDGSAREHAGGAADLLYEEINAPWQGGLCLENVSDAASRSPEGMQVCKVK